MVFQNLFKTLLFFSLLQLLVCNQNPQNILIQNYKKFCKDKYLEQHENNYIIKIDQYRQKRHNQYYNKQEEIINDLKSKNRKQIIRTTLAPFILLIIYASFVFVIFILYFFVCFDCIRCKNLKSSWVLAILFLISLVTCFITGIVYSTKASKHHNKAYCYFYKFQIDLIYGNLQDSNKKFLGFDKIQKISYNFQQNLSQIQQNPDVYEQILKLNFPQIFGKVYKNLLDFVSKNTKVLTSNGEDLKQVPLANQNLDPAVNTAIESEFNRIAQISSGLHNLAKVSLKFQDQKYYQSFKQVLQKMQTQSQEIKLHFTELIDKQKNFIKMVGHLKYGRRITTYSTIPLLFLFFLSIFLSICKKGKKFAYLVMIFSCLVLILISLGFIFWIFGVAEISGLCGIIRNINTKNLKDDKILQNQYQLQHFVNSCIDRDSKYDYFESIFQNQMDKNLFIDLQTFLNSIIYYNQFLSDNKKYSREIQIQIDKWYSIVSGLKYDHLQIKNHLMKFNKQIQCSNIYYLFTQQQCDVDYSKNRRRKNKKKCKSIYSNSLTYTAPSCISDTLLRQQNEQLYTQLAQYISDAKINAERLIEEIGKVDNEEQIVQIQEKQKRDMKMQKQQIQQQIQLYVQKSLKMRQQIAQIQEKQNKANQQKQLIQKELEQQQNTQNQQELKSQNQPSANIRSRRQKLVQVSSKEDLQDKLQVIAQQSQKNQQQILLLQQQHKKSQQNLKQLQQLQQQISAMVQQQVSISTPHVSFIYYLSFLRSQDIQQQMQQIQDIHREYIEIYNADYTSQHNNKIQYNNNNQQYNNNNNNNKNNNNKKQHIQKQLYSFTDSLNCTTFYRDALRIEYTACYKFAYYNYSAVIVWSCIVILAFLYLLVMFCVKSKRQNINPQTNFYVNTSPVRQSGIYNNQEEINRLMNRNGQNHIHNYNTIAPNMYIHENPHHHFQLPNNQQQNMHANNMFSMQQQQNLNQNYHQNANQNNTLYQII